MIGLIETERFLLREIVEEDAAGMYALDADPEVHRYLGNKPVKSIEESRAVIKHIRRQYKENGIGRWAVVDKQTSEFVGWSGLKYEWNPRECRYYHDLGYRLRRAYWGQGIATETAVAALEYGFVQMNLQEIFAAAHIDNAASNRILTKIGFEFLETFGFEGETCNWYRIGVD